MPTSSRKQKGLTDSVKPFYHTPPVKATNSPSDSRYITVVITGQINIQIHFLPITWRDSGDVRSTINVVRQIAKDTIPIGFMIQVITKKSPIKVFI